MPKEEKLPIIYSAHHASDRFPGDYAIRTALTGRQRQRFSDYGTGMTVPKSGILTLQSTVSRGMVDLNRPPSKDYSQLDDSTLFREHDFEGHEIWKPGWQTTPEERQLLKNMFYDEYHNRLLHGVKTFPKPGIVIGWDNTAHKVLAKDYRGDPKMMKAFILSNQGREDSPTHPSETTTCDPDFLSEMAYQLARSLRRYNLPDEVRLNYVYKGGYIPEHYNTRRHPEIPAAHPVQSFQVEYDTYLTHNQATLTPNYGAMSRLRKAFEEAMYETYANFLKQNWNYAATSKRPSQ